MLTSAPRTAGAVLLTCALLMTAAPSAAAPARATAEGQSLLQAVQVWIAFWLPDAAPGSFPETTLKAVGSESEPSGGATNTEDDPLAQPQIGPEADPSG